MADSRTKRYSEQYNVMLDPSQKAMLDQMASLRGVPASQLVREWIDHAYRMAFNAEPRCVLGDKCKCPAVHALQAGQTITAAELLRQHGGQNGPQTPQPAS